MKKTLLLAAGLLLSLGLMTACGEKEEKNTLSIDKPTLNFTANDTDEQVVTVTTNAKSFSATAETGATWVTVTPADGKFSVKVSEYTEADAQANNGEARSATITVTAGDADKKTVTVKQAAPGEDTLSVDEDELAFAAEADNTGKVVTVTTSAASFTATPDEEAEWITVTPADGKFTVTVKEYAHADALANEFEDRTATITVSAGNAEDVTVTVTQTPYDYSVTFDPESLTLTPDQTTAIIDATTKAPSASISVVIPEEYEEWITSAFYASGTLNLEFKILVGTADRTGHVILKSDYFDDVQYNITQQPNAALDLTGNWKFVATLKKGNSNISGNIMPATYDDELGGYIFVGFPNMMNSANTAGIILTVDESNNVTFEQRKWTKTKFSSEYIGNYTYSNYAIATEVDGSGTKTFDKGEAFTITVSDNGNTLTFPTNATIDGVNYLYTFGSGMTSDSGTEPSPTASVTAQVMWSEIVFTRVVEE